MVIKPKEQFELLKTPNIIDIPTSYLKSNTLATGNELLVYAKSILQQNNMIVKDLDVYIKRSLLITYHSPLPVLISIKDKRIYINASAVTNKFLRFHPKFIGACVSCGRVFFEQIPFVESLVVQYISSMLIRIFGKKYGLITTDKKHQLMNAVSKYVAGWRNNYSITFDTFMTYLNQTVLPDVTKAALISYVISWFGIVGLTSLEDYYRLIGNILASVFKISLFKPSLFTVNNAVSQEFIKLWYSHRG